MPKLYCPPPLRVSAESVQSMHQDRCRCIQVHTLRLCPPFPVRACAFGLYLILLYLYYNTVILIVKCSTYSNPQDRSRTDLGSQPHVCSLFSFVFRGDKSRPTADCQSSTRGRGQEDYQALSYLQFHSLIWKNKSQEKNNGGQPRLPPLSLHRVCFREPLRKTLTAFFTATFRIFWGHRCILNLPCILRTGVVHFRSPSHQPSTSHHCVPCRWLGESRPST